MTMPRCSGNTSIVPGVRSSNLYIVDTATDPRAPRLHTVIEGTAIKGRTDLSAPHTVHCLGSEIIISMLGNAKGEAPGGYLHLDKDFNIVGRWEASMGDIPFSYDFWYQPRHNVMATSEWAAPNTFMPGFDLEEVGHLKYGRRHPPLGLREEGTEADVLPRRGWSHPAGGALPPRPQQQPRLLSARRFRPTSSTGGRTPAANGNGKRSSTSKTSPTRNGRFRSPA